MPARPLGMIVAEAVETFLARYGVGPGLRKSGPGFGDLAAPA